MFTVHLHKNVNNNLQQMHFQYIYCVSTSTPTCFGRFGPSSGSYTVKCDQVLKQYAVYIKTVWSRSSVFYDFYILWDDLDLPIQWVSGAITPAKNKSIFLFNGYRGQLLQQKIKAARPWNWPVAFISCRSCEAISPIPHTPSRCATGIISSFIKTWFIPRREAGLKDLTTPVRCNAVRWYWHIQNLTMIMVSYVILC
jgi:hypothetical protein